MDGFWLVNFGRQIIFYNIERNKTIIFMSMILNNVCNLILNVQNIVINDA